MNRTSRVELRDGLVEFRSETRNWSVAVRDIAVIGEYTDASGPVGDDWFLVLVPYGDGSFFSLPIETAGLSELLAELGQILGVKLEYQLANSAHWKSVVKWPLPLAGMELMRLVPASQSSLMERVKNLISRTAELELSGEISSYLSRAAS